MRTIISASEVRERLGDPQTVIVDCRHSLQDFGLGRRLYDEAHVPGAFFASVEEDLSGPRTGTNGRHPMPEPEAFAGFLRGLGVDDSTLVVAYDAGGDMFAPRLWFLSRWIGHDEAAVLDGGFAAWRNAGYPMSDTAPQPSRTGRLTVRLRPELVVSSTYVLAHLDDPGMQLLDVRAVERYCGDVEPVDPVAGHIPGARNRWFKNNFNGDGTLKSPDRLRAEFAAEGLLADRIVSQCGSGVSAAANYWAMEHAGLHGSRVYGGSWSEWISDPARPVATGASSAAGRQRV